MYNIKINKKDFKLFKKECRKWQKKLGLISWEFFYEHIKLEGAQASTHSRLSAMRATLRLSTDIVVMKANRKYIVREIKSSAFHEVAEIFIARLSAIAGARYIAESEIEEATHEIIHRLENVLCCQ